MSLVEIRDHGAVGDGATDDTLAIQAAIDACAAAGGGRVLVGAPGTYLAATIELRDDVELHVQRGATITASGRWDAYRPGPTVTGLSSGIVQSISGDGRALVWAHRASRVAITGGGVIDGGGRHFVVGDTGEIYEMAKQRPFTVFLLECANVTIRDVEIVDAAFWTVRLSVCTDVLVDGVRIHNDPKLPNNDGIDLDWCRRARISDCDIDTGDDAISLKTCAEFAAEGRACEDVIVSGCTIRTRSSALVVGADIAGPIRRAVFSGCTVRESHRGLSVNVSQGETEIGDLLFCDCVVETQLDDESWWGNGEPIYVSAEPWHDDEVGTVRRVAFRNILCHAENGVVVQGARPGLVRDVAFDSVRLRLSSWTGRAGGRLDLRPSSRAEFRDQPTAGFYLEHAGDVRLRDCAVAWDETAMPWWGPALQSRSSAVGDLEGLSGPAGRPGLDAVVQE